MWESIIGHETNKTFLKNMLTGERQTPSLLFCGPEGIGKKKMARAFARSFLCLEDPLVPCHCRSCQAMDNGLAASAALGPVLSPFKVCLIDEAHTMREEAQNSLLKLLEEPPDYWLFILVADDREKLLPTIRSRVMELRFDPLSMEDTERVLETIRLQENDRPESLKDAELSQAEARWREQLPILARLAGGSAGKALKWFRLDALTLREEILDLVEQAGREDILVYADGLPWMLKNDRQESLVLMELLLLLFRDGLILETGLSQPLYNEDLRQRLAMCFAGWTEGMLRKGLELEEKCRRAIASFVTRRMAVEALALEIHQML